MTSFHNFEKAVQFCWYTNILANPTIVRQVNLTILLERRNGVK